MSDPGPCCCEYGDFYDREGIMPPIHDCPAPAPIVEDELDAPLTPLEHHLLKSLHFFTGIAEGRIIDLTGRWR